MASSFSFSLSSSQPHLPLAASLMAPIVGSAVLQAWGIDLHVACYAVLIGLLSFTGAMLWLHVFRLAWRAMAPSKPLFPPASAIAVGSFPEDSSYMAETIRAFRNLSYQGPLDIILAYSMDPSSSSACVAEEEILSVAATVPFPMTFCRASESSSVDENIQLALQKASGEVVAIFHAGHCPKPDAMDVAARCTASEQKSQKRSDGCGRTWDVQEIHAQNPAVEAASAGQKSSQLLNICGGKSDGWYGMMQRCVPWAAVQIAPLAALLLLSNSTSPSKSSPSDVGNSYMVVSSSNSTPRIASSIILSSSY